MTALLWLCGAVLAVQLASLLVLLFAAHKSGELRQVIGRLTAGPNLRRAPLVLLCVPLTLLLYAASPALVKLSNLAYRAGDALPRFDPEVTR